MNHATGSSAFRRLRPRVLLADDHRLVLDAFEELLSPEFEIVGKVADGWDLVEQAPDLAPDVIVLDISMPRLNGLDAAAQLRQSIPDARLIVVTMHTEPRMAARAPDLGVLGYLLKSSAGEELRTAVRRVMTGETFVTSIMPREELDALLKGGGPRARRELTPRQREVLQLLAEGRSMKQVGRELNLSTRTVAFHKYRIMKAHGIDSDAGLFQLAVKEDLVPLQP